MMNRQDHLPESWKTFLAGTTALEMLPELLEKVSSRRQETTVFPPAGKVFHAFELTPPQNIRAVIIGQDPYHDEGQAHGLAFSVPDGMPMPPSLKNIFKEYARDLNRDIPTSPSLENWAKSGILLLNSILTVDAHAPGSHRNFGWEKFTDAVISAISRRSSGISFILWGSYAIKKSRLIDSGKHKIITGVHPSPLSAYRGFFGSSPFSQALDDWPEI